MHFEPRIAFSVAEHEAPGLEAVVNFGILTGREATLAEVDDLARQLVSEAGRLEIIAERRYEFDERSGAEVHLVRVIVPADLLPWQEEELQRLRELVVARSEHWARACAARRQLELADL